VEAVRTITDN
jgi:hypothetical protein